MKLLDPDTALHRLKAAFKKEEEKYETINKDRMPDYDQDTHLANYWGFVITAYFLLEQSMKILSKNLDPDQYENVKGSHKLSKLVSAFDSSNLEDFYQDIVQTEKFKNFPVTYMEFFEELDSDEAGKVGNAWRYFPIETDVKELPFTTEEQADKIYVDHYVRILHELIQGCLYEIQTKITERQKEDSLYMTYSYRQFWEASHDVNTWILYAYNSPDWTKEDKIFVFNGPDWKQRSQFVWYENEQFVAIKNCTLMQCAQFGKLPKTNLQIERVNLEMYDLRSQVVGGRLKTKH